MKEGYNNLLIFVPFVCKYLFKAHGLLLNNLGTDEFGNLILDSTGTPAHIEEKSERNAGSSDMESLLERTIANIDPNWINSAPLCPGSACS